MTSEHSECQAPVPDTEPAIGITSLERALKKGKIKAAVDCLDTAPCTGDARILERDTMQEYGVAEDITIGPGTFEKIKIALNQAGIQKLEQDGELLVNLRVDRETTLGAQQEAAKAVIQNVK